MIPNTNLVGPVDKTQCQAFYDKTYTLNCWHRTQSLPHQSRNATSSSEGLSFEDLALIESQHKHNPEERGCQSPCSSQSGLSESSIKAESHSVLPTHSEVDQRLVDIPPVPDTRLARASRAVSRFLRIRWILVRLLPTGAMRAEA